MSNSCYICWIGSASYTTERCLRHRGPPETWFPMAGSPLALRSVHAD